MRKRAFIIGGGPSLKDFDFSRLRDEDTIITNKSILDVPSPNYFITVDYTFAKKIGVERFSQIKIPKVFVADFSHPFLKERDGRIVDERFNLVYHLNDFNVIVKSYRADGIGYSFDDFRTGRNSGFCALQLAVVLGYKEIYLLGIDLNTVGSLTHYHGGYGESKEKFDSKLLMYFKYFKEGLEQLQKKSNVQVFSCSENSSLNSIIAYKNLVEVTNE